MVIVDKEIDKEQIQGSSFIRVKGDPTEKHINNVRECANKWHAKRAYIYIYICVCVSTLNRAT